MAETIRLEEFTGIIQNKVVVVWSSGSGSGSGSEGRAWLPTEFLLSQYITRILVTGRTSPMSVALGADVSWTQVWRAPGAKEWSCLLGILQHMPGPVLLVVGPDIVLTPKIVVGLREAITTVVMRSVSSVPWPAAVQADHVFFPVLSQALGPVLQEWTTKAVPRSLDLKTLVPQLVAAGYGLTVADGVWHWFIPADSPPLVTLTVVQVAQQLQVLGVVLEKMTV